MYRLSFDENNIMLLWRCCRFSPFSLLTHSSQRQESHSINNIAILHPRKLVIYSVRLLKISWIRKKTKTMNFFIQISFSVFKLVTTSGFAEHGNFKFGSSFISYPTCPVCIDIRDIAVFSRFILFFPILVWFTGIMDIWYCRISFILFCFLNIIQASSQNCIYYSNMSCKSLHLRYVRETLAESKAKNFSVSCSWMALWSFSSMMG